MEQRKRRAVPLGWELHVSRQTGIPFYFNFITGQTQWQKPRKRRTLCTNEVFSLSDEGPLRRPRPSIIKCRHILVKHYLSDDPTGLRGQLVTRSSSQAFNMIKGLREQIITNKIKFKEAAKCYSDCLSAVTGGKLKPILIGTMEKDFEDAAFLLQLGEISTPIETRAGYHIVQRIE